MSNRFCQRDRNGTYMYTDWIFKHNCPKKPQGKDPYYSTVCMLIEFPCDHSHIHIISSMEENKIAFRSFRRQKHI